MDNARKALLKRRARDGNGVVLGVFAALVVWATRGNRCRRVLGLAMVINMFVAPAVPERWSRSACARQHRSRARLIRLHHHDDDVRVLLFAGWPRCLRSICPRAVKQR